MTLKAFLVVARIFRIYHKKGGNVSEYNKELCDERHENLDKALTRVFTKFDKVSAKFDKFNGKLNWFYIVTISTLLAVLANLFIEQIYK